MRLTRHEVVLWAEENAANLHAVALKCTADHDLSLAAGNEPAATAFRETAVKFASSAECFAFVVRALRDADLDPQQSAGQVQS